MLTERINQRIAEKAQLEEQLAIKENKRIVLSEPQVRAFLDYVRKLPSEEINKRRAIINIFVHSIYLYDDRFTLIVNARKTPLRVENIPLDEIKSAFDEEGLSNASCSSLENDAPPQRSKRLFACSDFFTKNQSALMPLLLLSKPDPLRWALIWWGKDWHFVHLYCQLDSKKDLKQFASGLF